MGCSTAGTAWRWVALLGFALFAPVSLPAGGADRRPAEVRRRLPTEPLLSSEWATALHCAPDQEAPVLKRLQSGAPLRVLRHWWAPSGCRWLQVEVSQ